ncbi:hypothetical protein J2S43_008099 [Catenuloplanes nepalensis]|uniref:Hemerythrin-like domain-containing protein n=1 Tax=Catenuloplanes nepalensis TaxID=587533 RepID=A0ABT9N7B0_9ACTN|nr:hypothetical protein [Catenuloplanes nepalensis]MDP9799587.1 hypothetical protein [Catenuloplanes nepalensis]
MVAVFGEQAATGWHPLLNGTHELARAIADPVHDDPAWRERVAARLRGLRGAFDEHMRATEGPAGHYAALVDNTPRLASGVDGLVREHAAVLDRISALQEHVDADRPGTDEIRDWARLLVHQLFAHRQHGADLVLEAYQTDIGGSD